MWTPDQTGREIMSHGYVHSRALSSALLVLLVMSTALVGCGSSGSSTRSTGHTATSTAAAASPKTSSTASTATTGTTKANASASTSGSLAEAIRRCVQSKGAAKCGVANGNPLATSGHSAGAGDARLGPFVACMRAHGVNASRAIALGGSQSSRSAYRAAYRAALPKCRAYLLRLG